MNGKNGGGKIKMNQKSKISFLLAFTLIILASPRNFAQEISFGYMEAQSWYMVERSNWSTYKNGSYIGLTHRETRSQLRTGEQTPAGIVFSGFFYRLQRTTRDQLQTALPIDRDYAAKFTLSPKGSMRFTEDHGYPEYRDFPLLPEEPVKLGDRWIGTGVRCIDPRNTGQVTELPIVVEYRFEGESVFQGERVWKIAAKFATRYPTTIPISRLDRDLKNATGTHDVQILVSLETGALRAITDRLDETFTFMDNSTLRYRGSTAIYTSGTAVREGLAATLEQAASDLTSGNETRLPKKEQGGTTRRADGELKQSPEPGWVTEETDRGVRISIRNLQFSADSANLLDSEQPRLDAVAKALLALPGGQFLVEGHTAATGKPIGEMELSIQRAKKVIEELCRRGLSAEQFIYRGFGGTVPLGDNATASGMALNRRVEITVME